MPLKIIFLLACILTSATPLTKSLENDFCDDNSKAECKTSESKISVLSEEEAQKIFADMGNLPNLTRDYFLDGCYARALKMAKFAESKGILVGKVFLEGVLRPKSAVPRKPPLEQYNNQYDIKDMFWGWHVAPVVYVMDKTGHTNLMILDPILNSKPMTVEDYKARLTQPGDPAPYISRVYYGNRYQYMTISYNSQTQGSWISKQTEDAEEILSRYQSFADQSDNLRVLSATLPHFQNILPTSRNKPIYLPSPANDPLGVVK